MSKDRKFNLSANHKATGKMTAGSLHPKSQWHKPDSGMTYFPRNKEDFIPIDELANVPTVCGSLREALESLQTHNDFLTQGSVFSKDQINAYVELKMEEVINFEHAPHPIEYQMYYSS